MTAACSAAQTPAATPPASEPTPVLATSAKDIVGAWAPPTADLYYEFNADGTFTVGDLLANGNRIPGDQGTFQFDGTRLTLQETESRSEQACGDQPGNYEVQVLAGDKLQFVKMEDGCLGRVASLSAVLSKLP
jgi:hypothetical protein